MSKTKRISYKGIPAKHRAQVAKLRKFRSLNISLLEDKPDTPQKIWKSLNKHWEKERAEEQAKKESDAKERAGNIKRHAIENLRTVIRHLSDAHEVATTIEDEDNQLDAAIMGKFVRLVLQEAGEKMEQSLCNLGIIEEGDHSYFMSDFGPLKREGAELPGGKEATHA